MLQAQEKLQFLPWKQTMKQKSVFRHHHQCLKTPTTSLETVVLRYVLGICFWFERATRSVCWAIPMAISTQPSELLAPTASHVTGTQALHSFYYPALHPPILLDCNGNLVCISFPCLILCRIQGAVNLWCTLLSTLTSDLENEGIMVKSGNDTELYGILKTKCCKRTFQDRPNIKTIRKLNYT